MTTDFDDMKDLDNTATNTTEHALFNKITHSAAFAKFTKVEGTAVEEAPSTTVVEAAAFNGLPDDLQDAIAAFLEAAFKNLKDAEADLRAEVTRLQNENPVTDAEVIKASVDELHAFEMDPQGQVMQDASANLLSVFNAEVASVTDADTAQICTSVISFMATPAGKAIADVLGSGRALVTEIATDTAQSLSELTADQQNELQEEKDTFAASPQGQAMATVQTGIKTALADFQTLCTA